MWGRIYRGIKGKGKQYYLPYNIEAVGKNINRGRGTEVLGKKIKIKKKRIGKIIKLQGTLYTPGLNNQYEGVPDQC